jgi:hypothetical protein
MGGFNYPIPGGKGFSSGEYDEVKLSQNGDDHCAKKLGKGGSDVRSISETFRRNPAGNQSRLVELASSQKRVLRPLG